MGCLATSYRVMLADRTVIGPIPASTIISMIQAGTIKPDHPIVNMDTGKAFFPDEDPVIRFLVGLDGPVPLPSPQLQPSLMGLVLPLEHPSSSKQQAVLVSFLIAMLIALVLLTRGIWLDTLTHLP